VSHPHHPCSPKNKSKKMDIKKIPSPCFVLEETLLRKNLEIINRVQKEADVQVILAFKGFAMWSAFPVVREYVGGATASSLHEARLCFEEMKTESHTYAVAYLPREFGKILQYSSHITFNSIAQWRKYQKRVLNAPKKVSPGIRVNPGCIEGLHFHVLCESSSQDLEKVLEHFEKQFGAFLPQVKWVNFGGGHLMTREGYDVPYLITVLKAFKKRWPYLQVILEPGSAFAWDAGVLVATVLDIVKNGGVRTAILDVSFTAHMPDTLEMPYRPRIRDARENVEKGDKHVYRLGGVSCLSGDFMEAYAFEKPLKVGQKIVFEDMIHYTMVKTSTFNGVTHPSIAIWRPDGNLDISRRFGYRDYRNRLS
jgi:carboxynorspermidine decarboxylase